jgi:glycosyltransferase involved in cell wall biosynthesis
MKKPFYSIGIIFKNEIRCLERCMKSLQPLREAVPCELVMADTGSTDGSREVAEKYADILFDFPWIDDFAAARNAVMDRCSGRWYLSIDADEWLAEDIAELTGLARLKKIPKDYIGVKIRNYRSPALEKSDNYLDFLGIRMARLSTGVRYEGCIHETWRDPKTGILDVIPLGNTWLYHDGYVYENTALQAAKRERNMTLLRKKLEEDPENLKTLTECVDSTKNEDKDASAEYAKRSLEGLDKKWKSWDRLGAVIYRNAVSVATLNELPEIEEWISQAFERFPDAIFTTVDVAYYAFVHYWDKKDYRQVIHWGTVYLKGVDNYRAGKYLASDLARGVLENVSPFWERKLLAMLPQAYLEIGEPEKAYALFNRIQGQEMDDLKQVELCTLELIRLHRTAMLDTPPLMAAFWEQVNQPLPDEKMAERRREMLLRTATPAFSAKYHSEELGRDDFLRHGRGVFSALEGRCSLGTAAAILETNDPEELEKLLRTVENWDELPIAAVEHALLEGAPFPVLGKPMKIEEMDELAGRMGRKDGPLAGLAILAAGNGLEDWQSLAWFRALALAAVKSCDWTDGQQGMALCRAFAKIEGAFLPKYYADDLLCDENIHLLPPMHRFGWYCGKAFWALDAGDSATYVRLLRQGLESCTEAKLIVEFLLKQLEESQKIQATPELLALAEQVRILLAAYPADDPAVEALKQSAAYQKVAHLIEGPELGIHGGLPQ